MAVEVIATIKPKNNGKFPVVEAADVDVNGKPLSEALNEFGNGNTPRFKVEDNDKLMVSYDNGKNFEDLATLPKGEKGNVTIDGAELKFFRGTQAQYNELSAEEKENLFAIITDDPEEGSLIGRINGFLDGSIPVPAAEKAEKAEILVGEEYDFTLLNVDRIIKGGVIVFKLVAQGNIEIPQDVRVITEVSGDGTCYSPIFLIPTALTYGSKYRFARLVFKSIGNGSYETGFQEVVYNSDSGKISAIDEDSVDKDWDGTPLGPGMYKYYYKHLLTYQN